MREETEINVLSEKEVFAYNSGKVYHEESKDIPSAIAYTC